MTLKPQKNLLQCEEIIVSSIIYHSQQCAEKSFKTYLIFKNQDVLKTHDLIKLLNECQKFDKEFYTLLSDAQDLNPYITTSRYPDNVFIMPSVATAEILFQKAANIFNFVKDKIN